MRLVLFSGNGQCDITEALVVKQIAKILGQFAFGYFELDDVALSRYVDTVGHHAHFAEYCQLVFGQEAVRFVEQKISPDELFEAPIFALDKSVRSMNTNDKRMIFIIVISTWTLSKLW